MKRTIRQIGVALVLVLLAAPAWAQSSLIDDLIAERAKYGATMSDDECAELVNAVAWQNRADGWGLSGKTFGTHGTLYDGTQIAHDILHHRPSNRLFDVLRAAGAESAPVWNDLGVNTQGNRPWTAPIAPRGAPVPPPGPFPGGDWEAKHAEVLLRFGPSATTRTVAEQLVFLWPQEGWGMKSADPSRPLSHDVIARRYLDGRLVGFRVIPPSAHPMQFGLPGQHYVPVAGVDHLGMGTPPPPVEPPIEPLPGPAPPATDLQSILDAIAALGEKVEQLEGTINGFGTSVLPALARIEQVLDAQPTAPPGAWPEYVGSILGRTVVLTPRTPR